MTFNDVVSIDMQVVGGEEVAIPHPKFVAVNERQAVWASPHKALGGWQNNRYDLDWLSYLAINCKGHQTVVIKDERQEKKPKQTQSPMVVTAKIADEIIKFVSIGYHEHDDDWIILKTPHGFAKLRDLDILSSIPQADIL